MGLDTPSPRGKLLREDWGTAYGRGRDWPAYPKSLCALYALDDSTAVVCALCGRPTGGLRLDSEGQFVHRDLKNCSFFGSQR